VTPSPPDDPVDDALDEALDSALRELDHLGEGEPDGLGIDHVSADRFGENSSVETVVERIATEREWDRLERPDYEDRQIAARLFSVKEAASKALGTGISEELSWTDLAVPRLAERPFRVQCERYDDLRIYAASLLVRGTAVAAAATFPKDDR